MIISQLPQKKMGNSISQILMLYFWLRIYLKAFSITCHGCGVKVSESLSCYAIQQDSFWPDSRCSSMLCSQPAFPDASRRGWGRKTPKLLICRDERKMWSWWVITSLVPWLAMGSSVSSFHGILSPLPWLEPTKLLFLLLLSYLVALFYKMFCSPQG